MSLRLIAVLVFALVPLTARAADDENPYRNAKLGDYAKYFTHLKSPLGELKADRVQTVTAASDKELTLRTVIVANGKELPNKKPEHKLDLTKPFDPLGTGDGSVTESYKWEKVKDGKEKVKVGGKEYDCTWTSYKAVVTGKLGTMTEGELKVWLSRDIPFVVKRTFTLKAGTDDILYTAVLTEFGNKK